MKIFRAYEKKHSKGLVILERRKIGEKEIFLLVREKLREMRKRLRHRGTKGAFVYSERKSNS